MTFQELVQRLDPDVYRSLKTAIELGKWPDGRRLDQSQKELCMEAVLYYERVHGVPEEERVGFIDRNGCGSSNGDDQADPVRILN
ncbi:DUF1315 family protein [Marinobacteraceae bacterium S3BR75-40.1]